ncbi:MAG: hypothetical protein KBA31_17095 [Alphaproteobacteria bacterium]|nr:hypothetical protein [Alphaproteobacteria bacterium]
MLNRCAVIIRPAQPFLDWAAALDDSGDMPDPGDEQTVYLLPDLADGGDIDEMIAEAFDIMFENELGAWHTHEPDWPKPRTLAMFKQWFTIEVHSVIQDLVQGPLVDDELE